MTRVVLFLVSMSFIAVAAGCAAYATPGRGADMSAFGVSPNATIQAAFDKRPMAHFPTGIAVVRVQQNGYRSQTAESWGTGRYSIVTTRDIEDPKAIERLGGLPQVAGVAPINRLLLPENLQSDVELRQAAAQLHADMLLIYTIDTTFHDSDMATPLSIVTLGLSPTQKTQVISTASAVLMDTRNGYIYGVAEATDRRTGLATAWNTESAIDSDRRKTESAAFNKLVDEMEKTWAGVIKNRPTAVSADVVREPGSVSAPGGGAAGAADHGGWRIGAAGR